MDIKSIRESAFMTQKKFANEIGVHENTVRSWEQGKKQPRLAHKEKIYIFCSNRGIKYE